MSDNNRNLADQVDADIQEAVDALCGSAEITMARAVMPRELRREFLMQEALREAELQEHEGNTDLGGLLRRVEAELRRIQPKVVATGQGNI